MREMQKNEKETRKGSGRELKFRAWNGKKMYVPDYVSGDGRGEFEHLQYEGTCFVESTLMQYTGLHDKNGKEIYEGDVVKYIFPNNGNEGIAPVQWEYGEWNVTDFTQEAGSCNIYNLTPAVEVIGNIYENPELLPK